MGRSAIVNTSYGRPAHNAVKAYRAVDVKDVEDATPHRLIQMLMTGALDRIASAKGMMERKMIAEKGAQISSAISIIDCLRASLDHSVSSEISLNLDELYRYMMHRLAQANAKNEPAWLDEVASLLKQIKSAWDQIPPEVIARHAAESAQ
jgi:flagellar protein FliS